MDVITFFRTGSRRFICLVAGLCLVFTCPPASAAGLPDQHDPLHPPGLRPFQLDSDEDLHRLNIALDRMLDLGEQQKNEHKIAQRRLLELAPLSELPVDQLRKYHHPPDDHFTKKQLRGFEILRELLTAFESAGPAERNRLRLLMYEVALATRNSGRSPTPGKIELIRVPWVHLDYLNNPVAKGTKPAANLPGLETMNPADERGTIDPPNSTFWTRPQSISTADLFAGFNRAANPDFTTFIWEYHDPKTSYGGNPGFEARHGDTEIKVKFAEVHSEPFAARLFHALGYNVDPTDFAPRIKLRYDRRLFREFHMRKKVSMQIRLLWLLPLASINLQKHYDPFDYIDYAVLKDGARLDREQFKERLLLSTKSEHPEEPASNYDPSFEAQIDHLVTVPANIQIKDDRTKSIGPWEFEGLGHEDLRELRGACLLAAWIGWFDSRFENTRLRIVRTGDDTTELKHYFTDLGGGLGRPYGLISRTYETPDLFDWTFTLPPRPQGPGRMTRPFEIINFQPIEETPAFREMTIDDARWMARMIAQLTPRQLHQALSASGVHGDDLRLYLDKLVNRRDRMIEDLDLTNDIPFLRPTLDESFIEQQRIKDTKTEVGGQRSEGGSRTALQRQR